MPPEVTPAHILSLARAFYNVKVVEPLTLKTSGAGVLAATPETCPGHVLMLACAPRNLKFS